MVSNAASVINYGYQFEEDKSKLTVECSHSLQKLIENGVCLRVAENYRELYKNIFCILYFIYLYLPYN